MSRVGAFPERLGLKVDKEEPPLGQQILEDPMLHRLEDPFFNNSASLIENQHPPRWKGRCGRGVRAIGSRAFRGFVPAEQGDAQQPR